MRWQPINSRWHFDWRFNCQYVIVSQYINLVPAGRQTVPTNSKFYDTILRHQGGGRLNKKDGLTRYGNSHVKDKTS